MAKIFRYVDDWASIRLVDSFVKICKAGTGSGEASLYMGSRFDSDIFVFFGEENFDAHCIMQRDDVLEYLESVKWEYISHRFNYRNEVSQNTWNVLVEEVKCLPEELFFDLTRKRQEDKLGRVYAQELTYRNGRRLTLKDSPKAYAYDLLRRIAIPEVTFLMLSKLGGEDFVAKPYYDPEVMNNG